MYTIISIQFWKFPLGLTAGQNLGPRRAYIMQLLHSETFESTIVYLFGKSRKFCSQKYHIVPLENKSIDTVSEKTGEEGAWLT